jgi:hypothetical protein
VLWREILKRDDQRLDSLCLVVDHQWSPITSLCRTREKTYQCISFLFNTNNCIALNFAVNNSLGHEYEQLTFRPWSGWKCKKKIRILSMQKACEITIDSYYMFIKCHNYNIYCILTFCTLGVLSTGKLHLRKSVLIYKLRMHAYIL